MNIRLPLAVCMLTMMTAFGEEDASAVTAEGRQFFESKIRPVLAEFCYQCHSSEEKIRGGLVLNTREGMRHGGDSGSAVVPGELESSLLWKAVTWSDSELEMPPKQKLPANAIEDIRRWILMGAPDPRVVDAEPVLTEIDVEVGRDFWSFKNPVKPKLPTVRNRSWPTSKIDRFVLAKLESNRLKPSVSTGSEKLLRRVSIDLTGLLPSPKEIEEFVAAWKGDPSAAYRQKVDELLESKHFGERWGRHWLDVARFAESSGKDLNVTFPHAWRYRDYVIDAFNDDKPYDEFIREQIAGDLLPMKDDEDWQENLIATGFLAMGPKGLNERNPRQFAMDLVDEQIDATSQAILGLTIACARCHDHKFDPIPTVDYYAIAGIFQSSVTHFGTVRAGTNRRANNLLELPIADEEPVKSYSGREIAAIKTRLKEAEQSFAEAVQANRRQRVQQAMRQNGRANGSTVAPANPLNLLRLRSTVAQLRARLEGMDENGDAKSLVMGMQDRRRPVEANVLIRGEVDKPAQKVPRGFLQVLPHTHSATAPSRDESGRMEFAQWLTSKDNPLTARVMVNRIWQQLFGRGLVASANDFGATGQAPTHPELLDYLAIRFMEEDWSIKTLIRELVATRTYRQSSAFDRLAHTKDPDNALLWRMPPRRLDAEALRDNMLLVGGRLDRDRPQGSLVAEVGDAAYGRQLRPERLERAVEYRSVYLPRVRDALPESLDLFDAADPNRVSAIREITNVPGQALYLMNNPFVIAQGEALARRLFREAESAEERVSLAYAIVYGRSPSREERASAINYVRQFARAAREFRDRRSRRDTAFLAMATFSQSLLASAEFCYVN